MTLDGIGHATLVGNCLRAAAAVVAASRPEPVTGPLLVGPFLPDHRLRLIQTTSRVAMAPLWQ